MPSRFTVNWLIHSHVKRLFIFLSPLSALQKHNVFYVNKRHQNLILEKNIRTKTTHARAVANSHDLFIDFALIFYTLNECLVAELVKGLHYELIHGPLLIKLSGTF